MWGDGEATDPAIGDRLTHLEQSVDAVAIEVERIGEGQRFVTRLFAENGAAPVPGVSGAAAPIGAAATDTPPPAHRS
jgi:hypothetical protein